VTRNLGRDNSIIECHAHNFLQLAYIPSRHILPLLRFKNTPKRVMHDYDLCLLSVFKEKTTKYDTKMFMSTIFIYPLHFSYCVESVYQENYHIKKQLSPQDCQEILIPKFICGIDATITIHHKFTIFISSVS
jgi:hypothetical protein